jgi:tetratricopeptide (TPR) repeat protein
MRRTANTWSSLAAFTLAVLTLAGCAQHIQSAKVVPPPSMPAAMARQVRNAIDAGDGDIELRALRGRVISEPENLPARLELGRAYEKRGYPELALDHYRLAAGRFPASSDAHLLLAQALDNSGQSAEAAASLGGFLFAYPQSGPALYSWLGILRDNSGDWKSGEMAHREALAKARASHVDHDYLHNNLGYALLMQGDKENAAIEFRAALKLNPRSEIARDNLGVAVASNPHEAILNWQSLNEPATAHSNLAAILIEQGKYSEARKELEVALQYNRSNPVALANLKLLSDLEGKPVTIPVQSSATRWSRAKSTWRQWLSGDKPSAEREPIQTASQSSESKQ